jgi:hypothetical protein
LTKRVIAFFWAVEPLAVNAGLPPQLTFAEDVPVGELLPVALSCPPHADIVTAVATMSAAPIRLLAKTIGAEGACRTAFFRAGMRHANKIACSALMLGNYRIDEFSHSLPAVSRRCDPGHTSGGGCLSSLYFAEKIGLNSMVAVQGGTECHADHVMWGRTAGRAVAAPGATAAAWPLPVLLPERCGRWG